MQIRAVAFHLGQAVLKMTTKAKLLLCKWIVAFGLANFLVFVVLAIYLGGDAVNGKVEGGHYYLMSHGRFTEVSEHVFAYSKWHAHSVWVTHPLALIAAYWSIRLGRASKNI